MKGDPKRGTFVRSHYRAPWTGVVIDVTKRKDAEPLVTCLLVRDRHGNPFTKRHTRCLSVHWTTPCAPVDVSMYPADWFERTGAAP